MHGGVFGDPSVVMKPRHILALDQGTSSSRAIVFDERARPIARAQHEIDSSFPRAGWVEQDPTTIVASQIRAARDALEAAGVAADAIAAVGIANQRETTVAWRRDGRAIHPAIVWQDRRTDPMCASLRAAGLEPGIRGTTGLLLDPYFSATKMAWLLDAVPDARRMAEGGELLLGTVDTFLAWHLTAGATFATDVSNASRTLVLDLAARTWSEPMLGHFGVPRTALPEVRPTDADFGATAPHVLGAPIPLRSMAGDQQAALFGQRCFAPGMGKNTYGTGCFLLVTTGDAAPVPPDGLLATVAWERTDGQVRYALEGSVFVAGAAVRWLRDGLGIISGADEVEALARSVEDSGGVVVVPAFAGLGAPYWEADARGGIFGITSGTTRAHIARAVLEAIAHQSVDLIEALEDGGGPRLATLRVDGGAAVDDLLLQLQADLLGRPVERAGIPETTALGAALLAGRAVGLWSDDDELASLVTPGRVFEPVAGADWRGDARRCWKDAVARTRAAR
jgi:glycerol kinase